MIRPTLIAGLLLTAVRCFAPDARLPPDRMRTVQLNVQGINRKALLYVPTDIERGSPRLYPLVLAFHERDGDPQSFVRLSRNRFQELAEARRFFIAFPVAVNGRWKDEQHRTADVLFTRLLLDELIRSYPIAPEHVHAAGFDAGAFFTLRLVCEMPDRLRSVSVIGGGLQPGQTCLLQHPVSVLIAHGTADPIVPFQGGEMKLVRESFGQVLPFAKTVQILQEGLSCSKLPDSVEQTDRNLTDHTSATIERYTGCRNRRRLQAVTIRGGGHTWPDGWSSVPPEIIGPLSDEWNAAENSIDFFFTGNEEHL